MKEKIASRINELTPSGIRKVNEKALQMEKNGEKVIHLEIGRPDFDTPEYIKKAGIENIEKGNVFYTSNFGTTELREAISEKLRKENGIPYKSTEILVTAGLSEAIYDVLSTILEEGDEILIPDPVWVNYLNVPKLFGAKPISYDLLEANEYQVDIEEIKSKITNKTKAIVLITPNNPTGGVLSKKVLESIAEIAIKNDLIVISDEVYERIIFGEEEHISIASLNGMKERTITLNGFSKAYSMTGWRLGYVATSEELIPEINKIHQPIATCAPSFVQAAGVVALRDEKDEVENMIKEYKKRRDYVVKEINQIDGISCLCPKGSFYIFINIKELGKTSEEVASYLLDEAKVAMVPGNVFGKNGEGYIRMSFANSYENLVEACERLKDAIKKLN